MDELPPSLVRVVIVGAGGFGREVLQYVRDVITNNPQIQVKGFLDDDSSTALRLEEDAPWISEISDYRIQPEDRFVVAIGDPATRKRVILELQVRGARFFSVIHPTARIAKTAHIGGGCILAPFVSVGNQARLEEHVVMVWYSSVAHDAHVGAYAVFSPYSTINGGAVLEEGAFLGTRATVNPLQRVGAWAKVAAGAVVYQTVDSRHLAMGNPAKARPMLHGDPNEAEGSVAGSEIRSGN